MARGLSDTQKTILKVISDLPESTDYRTGGLNNYCSTIHDKLKSVLYPNLYNQGNSYGYGRVKHYGCHQNEKNSARVTISKSLKRLEERGLITYKNPQGYPGTWRIYLTTTGKLMVNELPKTEHVNQYEEAIING